MVTAIILIKARREGIQAASQQILKLDGITEVYSVAGSWDLVAVARVKKNEQLAKLVTQDMIGIADLLETNTLIAFKQYSRYDLERMFSIGEE